MRDVILKRCAKYKTNINHENLEVWRFDYNNLCEDEVYHSLQCFEPDEKVRYKKYRIPKLKNQYALSRFLIKSIIANYLKCPIEDIKFEYTSKGKPFLKFATSNFYFNYSDTTNTGLLALSDVPIGVDIEIINNSADIFDSMDMIMTSKEIKWILEQDSFLRYFIVWTMKEAYLKCLGTGFMTDSIPDLSDLLNVPIRQLYFMNGAKDLYAYTDEIENYVFSLVLRLNTM